MGRQLARRLQLPFFDSDHVIEQQLGCSIREYFEREGEMRFRDVEQSVIDELTQKTKCVLSTGGGVVLRAANRQHLRERARVVYLNSSPEELYRRLLAPSESHLNKHLILANGEAPAASDLVLRRFECDPLSADAL